MTERGLADRLAALREELPEDQRVQLDALMEVAAAVLDAADEAAANDSEGEVEGFGWDSAIESQMESLGDLSSEVSFQLQISGSRRTQSATTGSSILRKQVDALRFLSSSF